MLEVVGPAVDDCWNRIGVAGDATCPELDRYVHCRNCPVFGSAARDFFRRPAPPGYLEEWAGLLASREAGAPRDLAGLLVFRLGIEWLAVDIMAAVEVTAVAPVHRVPHRTNRVLAGLVSLRGQLHPCVSLHGLLGIEASDPDTNPSIAPRLVLLRRDGETWAFQADEVAGVQHVARVDLRNVPSTLANPAGSFSRAVFGWGDRSVDVLDEPRLFLGFRRLGHER